MTGSPLKSRIQDAAAGEQALPESANNGLISSRSIHSQASEGANKFESLTAQTLRTRRLRGEDLDSFAGSSWGSAARTSQDTDDRTGPFRFGIPELDSLTGGIQRGAITEVLGPAGSGRAALILSALAHSTANRELCALVDTDMLDVASAAGAGIDLERLLWVRCPEIVDDALKATEMLLRSGCFGLVALDLTGISAKQANHISSACWIRFRRAIENGRTGLLVMEAYPCARAAAALALKLSSEQAIWEESLESLEGSGSAGSLESRRPGFHRGDTEPAEMPQRMEKTLSANFSNKGPACSNLLRAIKLTAERTKPYLYGSPSGKAVTSTQFIISIPH